MIQFRGNSSYRGVTWGPLIFQKISDFLLCIHSLSGAPSILYEIIEICSLGDGGRAQIFGCQVSSLKHTFWSSYTVIRVQGQFYYLARLQPFQMISHRNIQSYNFFWDVSQAFRGCWMHFWGHVSVYYMYRMYQRNLGTKLMYSSNREFFFIFGLILFLFWMDLFYFGWIYS